MSVELPRHVGHACHLLDPRRLRCDDCTQTVWLPSQAGSTSTSSRSPIPGPGEPRCPQHQHEHADGCRTCAADAKGRPDDAPTPEHQPTADVEARAAEARAALPARRPQPLTPSPIDPERMAAARAELAGRQPIPTPDDTPDSSRP